VHELVVALNKGLPFERTEGLFFFARRKTRVDEAALIRKDRSDSDRGTLIPRVGIGVPIFLENAMAVALNVTNPVCLLLGGIELTVRPRAETRACALLRGERPVRVRNWGLAAKLRFMVLG
jgi:hypothetical protein